MRAVYYLSILLTIFAFGLATVKGEWTWSLLAAVALIIFLLPAILTKDFRKTYHPRVAQLYPLPFLAYIILALVDVAVNLEYFTVYSYAIYTFAAMVCGMLLMMAVSASTPVKISKRWILLFAIAFACAFAIICTFMTYFGMVTGGWLVANDDFVGGIDNTPSNRHLMLPCFLTTFLSLLYGYLFRCLFKRIPKTEIALYYEVN